MSAAGLQIYLHGRPVGHLVNQSAESWVAIPNGEPPLAPADCWSLKQLTSSSLKNQNLRPWFRGLLPDSGTCAKLALRLGLSPGNDFALLGVLGRDCPGALSLRPSGRDAQPFPPHGVNEPRPSLDEALLALRSGRSAVLADLAIWPDDESLLAVTSGGSGPELPAPGVLSDAFIRWGRFDLPEAVVNEAFCMALARTLGLPVVNTALRGGQDPWLLIERPDHDPAAPAVRVHLEGFRQLAGLAPEQSFEREGGLALLECANLIRRYSCVPALDLRSLLRWVGLSYLVGNGLACARDLGFLFTPNGPRLAPFSSILSTHVYAGMSERLGFFIGKEDRPDWLLPARWREAAEELGISHRYLLALLLGLADELMLALPGLSASYRQERGVSRILESVEALIGRRVRQLRVAFEAERT